LFSGRPSVPPSVIHVVVLCFRDISSICWRIFAKLLSLVHLGMEMKWLDFGVKRSKFKVTAWPNASQIFIFPLYLQYLLVDFRQTFVAGASWDTDDLITFLGQKVKVQGHTIAAEAHSTRRYRRVQLFLVIIIIIIIIYYYYYCKTCAKYSNWCWPPAVVTVSCRFQGRDEESYDSRSGDRSCVWKTFQLSVIRLGRGIWNCASQVRSSYLLASVAAAFYLSQFH